MKNILKVIFPKVKNYDDLEEPVKACIDIKTVYAFLSLVGMIIIPFIKTIWQIKIASELMLLIVICVAMRYWWLFITDSVCSLEAKYLGRRKGDENEGEKSNKLKHRYVQRAIYLEKDGVKYEIAVKSYDESLNKGDIVKFYTTPNCVYSKANGLVSVTSVLCLFVTKAVSSDDEKDVDEKKTK